MAVQLKTPDEIAIMREAGRIVARAHAAMKEALRPGISTGELDKIAETVIRDHGAVPAFLNYPKPNAPNYPGTINASINNELVHGLPNMQRFVKGMGRSTGTSWASSKTTRSASPAARAARCVTAQD